METLMKLGLGWLVGAAFLAWMWSRFKRYEKWLDGDVEGDL